MNAKILVMLVLIGLTACGQEDPSWNFNDMFVHDILQIPECKAENMPQDGGCLSCDNNDCTCCNDEECAHFNGADEECPLCLSGDCSDDDDNKEK